jgi:hypothetical protein
LQQNRYTGHFDHTGFGGNFNERGECVRSCREPVDKFSGTVHFYDGSRANCRSRTCGEERPGAGSCTRVNS